MIPGVAGFSVSTPYFKNITLHLPKGKLKIEGGSMSKPYIHSMEINGKKAKKTWIDWTEIQNGAFIKYKTSEKANIKWGL